MGNITLDLPFVSNTFKIRGLEAELNNGLIKEINKITLVGLINTLCHVQNTNKHGIWKLFNADIQYFEGLLDQMLDILIVFIVNNPGNCVIDLSKRFFVYDGESRDIHSMR